MRYWSIALAIVLALASFEPGSLAQTKPSSDMAAAAELMQQKKFAEAATSYEAILRSDPKNAPALNQLGVARYSLHQYVPAAEAYERNVGITASPFVMYNLA